MSLFYIYFIFLFCLILYEILNTKLNIFLDSSIKSEYYGIAFSFQLTHPNILNFRDILASTNNYVYGQVSKTIKTL